MKHFVMLSMNSEDADLVYAGKRRVLFLKRCWKDVDAVVFIYDRSVNLVTGVFSGSTPIPNNPHVLYSHYGELSAMTKEELLSQCSGSGDIYVVSCSSALKFHKGIDVENFGLESPPANFTYLRNRDPGR